jgi:hypothetical protein
VQPAIIRSTRSQHSFKAATKFAESSAMSAAALVDEEVAHAEIVRSGWAGRFRRRWSTSCRDRVTRPNASCELAALLRIHP